MQEVKEFTEIKLKLLLRDCIKGLYYCKQNY